MKFLEIQDLYFLLVIALIKVASWFSSPEPKEFIVKGIAFAAYHFSKNERRSMEKNLSQAFDGKLSENQKQRIVKGTFNEFWTGIFSLLPSSKERATLKRADVRGIEHLHRALEKGKGAILWESKGFGRRLLTRQILHDKGFSIHPVYADNHLGGFFGGSSRTWVRQHVIKRFFEKYEGQFVAEIIYLPRSDSLAFTRVLLGRLRQNAVICIAADGKSGQKLIPLEFLGHTDRFSTGMVSLAKISGAPILPVFCFEDRNGKINLIIEQPIHIETGVDREHGLENSVTQYVNLLEAYIQRYPEKYQTWHLLSRWSLSSAARR